MCDVTFPVMRNQRKGRIGGGARRWAILDAKNPAQCPVRATVAGKQLTADLAQDVIGLQHALSGGIRMDDAAHSIDQEYSGIEAVEHCRKTCRLGSFGL